MSIYLYCIHTIALLSCAAGNRGMIKVRLY